MSRMSRTFALSVWLSVPGFGAWVLPAAPLPEKLLPPATLAFVAAPDWPAALSALRQNAWGQLWADPALQPLREKFQASLASELLDPVREELGLALTNFTGLIHGQITLALLPFAPDASTQQHSFLMILDTGGQSSQAASNLAQWSEQRWASGSAVQICRIGDHDFRTLSFVPTAMNRALEAIVPDLELAKPGVPVTNSPVRRVEWTVGQVGSLVLLGNARRGVESVLTLLGDSSLPSLAKQTLTGPETVLFRQSQIYGWVNLKALLDAPASPSPSENNVSASETPGLIPLLKGLGLGSVPTIAFSLQQSEAGALMTLHLKSPFANRQGLFKAFELKSSASGPPPFVPADAVKFRRFRLDLPTSWTQFEKVLAEAFPAASGVLKLVLDTAGKDRDADYNFREALLSKLSDDLITFEVPSRATSRAVDAATSSMWLVGSRNAELTAAHLKALSSLLPPEVAHYKERAFLGRTLYSFAVPRSLGSEEPQSVVTLHYAPRGDYVALTTDAGLLEEFLRGTSRQASLLEKTGLAEAAQRVGGLDTGFFSYENDSLSARSMFEASKTDSLNAFVLLETLDLGSRLGLGRERGFLNGFDFSLLPSYDRVGKYFHFDVTSLVVTSEGYAIRYFAPTPPALRK